VPHSVGRMAGWTEELPSERPELAACRRAEAAWSTGALHAVNTRAAWWEAQVALGDCLGREGRRGLPDGF